MRRLAGLLERYMGWCVVVDGKSAGKNKQSKYPAVLHFAVASSDSDHSPQRVLFQRSEVLRLRVARVLLLYILRLLRGFKGVSRFGFMVPLKSKCSMNRYNMEYQEFLRGGAVRL